MRPLLDGIGLAMSLGFVIIIIILGCLGFGLWIDRQLNISPWGILLFMVLSILTSTGAVYLLVVKQYAQRPRSGRLK